MPLDTDTSQRDKVACLLFGLGELGLALFAWAVVTPYWGSTLDDLTPLDRVRVGAFLAFGPLSAFAAALAVLWHRRLGAAWFVVGGLSSGLMAVSWFLSDRGVILAPLVSVPMVAVGLWQFLLPTEPAVGAGRSRHLRIGSILLGIFLFVLGWMGTYALFLLLVLNNATGLRGEPIPGGFAVENATLADAILLVFVGGTVALLTMLRRRLKVRWELLAGQWAAVLLGAIVLLAR